MAHRNTTDPNAPDDEFAFDWDGAAENLKTGGADPAFSDHGLLAPRSTRYGTGGHRRGPSALDWLESNRSGKADKTPAVFLDYDGTLTPIVARPEDAALDDDVRRCLAALTRYCPVAVVSGRDLQDVRRRVDLANLAYAGSHGFDIAGPDDRRVIHRIGIDHLPHITSAERLLCETLGDIEGVQVERKSFSIAVHYRRVGLAEIDGLQKRVREVAARVDGLRLSAGKKVFELQPDVDWNKGRAVRLLIDEVFTLDRRHTLPIYIGDDTTDEDAFRELGEDGVGILVDDTGQRGSEARFHLRDPGEVKQFLQRLLELEKARQGR